jgi:hypothetical protein
MYQFHAFFPFFMLKLLGTIIPQTGGTWQTGYQCLCGSLTGLAQKRRSRKAAKKRSEGKSSHG